MLPAQALRHSPRLPLALLPLLWAPASPALAEKGAPPCRPTAGVDVFISPEQPLVGRPVRVLLTAAKPFSARATWQDPKGAPLPAESATRGGPPASLATSAVPTSPGRHRVVIGALDEPDACVTVHVKRRLDRTRLRQQGPVFWSNASPWTARHEDLFAAFIEALFDAPVDATLAFRPLAQALRDPARNLLHDHLQLGEDDVKNRRAIPAEPDCADLPYFLRAYFAWKLQLPFGYRDCDRGTRDRPPRCGPVNTNEQPTNRKEPVAAFTAFSRLLRNAVHSGSLRTALDDEETDFYPVPLDRKALRPGTVYADPYGHVLIVSRWVSQDGATPGLLFAVDGQPDASITRKRFWEGNFLFASDLPSAGAGWKTFRPLVPRTTEQGRALVSLANADLKAQPGPPYSAAQGRMSEDAFYARMGKLINPAGMNPETAYDEMLSALVEQLEARVRSVDNGETYMKKEGAGTVVEMPEGARIFETVGPWEDYATPSRDLRLLIAMKVLLGVPARITSHPDLYALGTRSPAEVRRAIEARHTEAVGRRFIEYVRSDGRPQRLSVGELLARRQALELAYNPNDCIELRWGAPEGSDELKTCTRRAPEAQRKRMESHRRWFAETRRPARE